MKRVILNATIPIVAFATGIAFRTTPQPTEPLPYCEIARNAASYNGKTIRARATLILGADAMYVFEDCDPVSALASLVELDGYETGRLKRKYVEEVLVSGNQENVHKVDAIITGRFDGEFSRGCWAPAFRIAATEIKFVSPVTQYELATSDTHPRTRH